MACSVRDYLLFGRFVVRIPAAPRDFTVLHNSNIGSVVHQLLLTWRFSTSYWSQSFWERNTCLVTGNSVLTWLRSVITSGFTKKTSQSRFSNTTNLVIECFRNFFISSLDLKSQWRNNAKLNVVTSACVFFPHDWKRSSWLMFLNLAQSREDSPECLCILLECRRRPLFLPLGKKAMRLRGSIVIDYLSLEVQKYWVFMHYGYLLVEGSFDYLFGPNLSSLGV